MRTINNEQRLAVENFQATRPLHAAQVAAELGIGTIVIALAHAWLDARADRQSRRTSSKDEGT